ncbi:MAG: hypothetical protein J7M11_03565 [Elusimicrobia bacterium]|nr:hypothetical protein [Elusimicrobiota bacterium]
MKMNSKIKKLKERQETRLLDHDTSQTIGNPDMVFKTFAACMKEGDFEAAREVLAACLRHLNKSRLEREYNIPRRTAYNLLQGKSVPGLDLIAKVCHAIDAESRISAQT